MLDKGVIEPCESSWASPAVLSTNKMAQLDSVRTIVKSTKLYSKTATYYREYMTHMMPFIVCNISVLWIYIPGIGR